MKLGSVTLFAFMLSILFGRADETNLNVDEEIVFYPTVAQRIPGTTNAWRATIRGCVFEVEKWRLLIATFRKSIELKTDALTAEESALFTNRARLFLVDNERRKRIFIRLGTNELFIGKTTSNGRFQGEITFTTAEKNQFVACTRIDDSRKFFGCMFPLEEEGVSVISDIDDTIKITEVRDRRATLRNTFLREFQAVPGMAEFYQTLARNPLTPSNEKRDGVRSRSENPNAPNANVAFHYISASPWQLYTPLAQFIATNGFPAGTFELKQFRWKDRSFFSLFANPEKYKPSVIEPLLKQFPKRKFILIGDSGERDPEIYGALARKFPEQITRIYIRDVTNEAADSHRHKKAFREVPQAKWQIFQSPEEIKLP
jgi:phosphatidate phosphatase APP1